MDIQLLRVALAPNATDQVRLLMALICNLGHSLHLSSLVASLVCFVSGQHFRKRPAKEISYYYCERSAERRLCSRS